MREISTATKHTNTHTQTPKSADYILDLQSPVILILMPYKCFYYSVLNIKEHFVVCTYVRLPDILIKE